MVKYKKWRWKQQRKISGMGRGILKRNPRRASPTAHHSTLILRRRQRTEEQSKC
jgi:hypothetical protein